jgi:hypothetical protein
MKLTAGRLHEATRINLAKMMDGGLKIMVVGR